MHFSNLFSQAAQNDHIEGLKANLVSHLTGGFEYSPSRASHQQAEPRNVIYE